MLSVRGSRQIRAVVLAVRLANRDLRNDINRTTREVLNPIWRSAIDKYAVTPLDRAVIAKGARIAPGNPPAAVAGTSRRALKGGFVPADEWTAVEFGANREKVTTYDRRSPSGTTHSVTRHTARQLPARRKSGRIAYRAFADVAPRAVAEWVQLVIRKYTEAAEKGGN